MNKKILIILAIIILLAIVIFQFSLKDNNTEENLPSSPAITDDKNAVEVTDATQIEKIKNDSYLNILLQIKTFDNLNISAMDEIHNLYPNMEHKEIRSLLARCGLRGDMVLQPIKTLSGGEQQMLAMGRALMSKPKLLLLDEPSMGLSPLLVDQVFEIIKQLRDDGTTILLVEQNASKALEIADRAYVLETGNITLSGTGIELAQSDEVRKAYLGG